MSVPDHSPRAFPFKADQLLTEALESGERALCKDDPFLLLTIQSLAILHADRGHDDAAEPEFGRGIANLEAAGLTEERTYHDLLNNLGVLYIMQNKYAAVRPYLAARHAQTQRPTASVLLGQLHLVRRMGQSRGPEVIPCVLHIGGSIPA